MQYETISYEIADDIAVLTLNRPEVMNALSQQMRAEITDAIRSATKDARLLVMTGAGRAFCSGQDLGSGMATNMDLERGLRDEYTPMIRAIAEARIPVMAAVNGPAAGAGANLALAADIVIASESAYFLQAFARIGLMPDAGGTWTLPQTMGFARAMGAALFADKIPARQAADWGMIWEAVPEAEFADHWRARASYLAKGPTEAFYRSKQAIRGAFGITLEAQMDTEARLQGKLGKTRDFQEGVMAFLEKRGASFEGR